MNMTEAKDRPFICPYKAAGPHLEIRMGNNCFLPAKLSLGDHQNL
jgi:hypothetical protein